MFSGSATRWWRSTLLGVVACAAFAACGSENERGGASHGLETAVGFSQDAWTQLLRKHEDDLVRCMRTKGFRFWSEANWEYLTLGPHGLFGLETPEAERRYLETYGYGVVQRVHVLRSEIREIEHLSNQQYAEGLPPVRRRAYAEALFGVEGSTGCTELVAQDVVSRLDLPDGAKVGEAFAKAVHDARRTSAYKEWESKVVRCLRNEGIKVPDSDLSSLERPFLIRLLRLAGSPYSLDDSGNVHYDLRAKDALRVRSDELDGLHRDELAIARIDARCRTRAGLGAQTAIDHESAEVVERYPREIAQLRRALELARNHNEKESQ